MFYTNTTTATTTTATPKQTGKQAVRQAGTHALTVVSLSQTDAHEAKMLQCSITRHSGADEMACQSL